MKKTISLYDFREEFHIMDRASNFSYNGLQLLYEFLEEVNPDMELDVIALCCEFEQDNVKYFLDQYELESIEELRDNTLVIDIPGSSDIIIQSY